jgi:3-hydroxybutyryl-CoA dehydrogenase
VLGEPSVGDALAALAKRMGHTPVRAQDTPGFIVNHASRGFLTEALRIVGEGIADFATIDRVLRTAAGFRLGPFELLDLTGLDVSYPVMESIYGQYYQEPRYRPSPIARQRLAAGLLGRKSGRGFYAYVDGKPQLPAAPAAPAASDLAIWISRRNGPVHAALSQRLEAAGVRLDGGERPAERSACIVLPVGVDATGAALDEGLQPQRAVALDPLFLDRQATLMTTPVTAPEVRDAAWAALAAAGLPVSVIHDSAGFVVQRVLAMIVNIACDIAQQRVATPPDIDRAVTLGLGYPQGPLEMGDALGASTVLGILDAMHDFYRDPRYRPSPWLIRRARLGVSLLTPEN